MSPLRSLLGPRLGLLAGLFSQCVGITPGFRQHPRGLHGGVGRGRGRLGANPLGLLARLLLSRSDSARAASTRARASAARAPSLLQAGPLLGLRCRSPEHAVALCLGLAAQPPAQPPLPRCAAASSSPARRPRRWCGWRRPCRVRPARRHPRAAPPRRTAPRPGPRRRGTARVPRPHGGPPGESCSSWASDRSRAASSRARASSASASARSWSA